jgi:predicted amidohydrolase
MRSGVDQLANAQAFEALAREAAEAGAVYIQSPEMTGMVQRDRQAMMATVRVPGDTPVLKVAERLSNELAVTIHIGSCAVLRQDGGIANRAFVFSPNAIQPATYDKIHMFDVNIGGDNNWQESAVYARGEKTVLGDLPNGEKLGLGICYDLRFPDVFRDQARAGATVLSAPACFTAPTGKAHWEPLIRARAIENGSFMVCAAQGGTHEDGRCSWGHSMVVNPWGEVTQLDHDEPGILMAEYDAELVASVRAKIPALANEVPFARLAP